MKIYSQLLREGYLYMKIKKDYFHKFKVDTDKYVVLKITPTQWETGQIQ